MRLQKITYSFITFIATVYVLYIGKVILMPIVMAFIAWFVIKELLGGVNKVSIKRIRISVLFQKIVVFVIVTLTFVGIGSVILASADGIIMKLPEYQKNATLFFEQINLPKDISLNDWFKRFFGEFNLSDLLSTVVSSISSLFSNALLIVFYLIFILLESSSFSQKLKLILHTKKTNDRANTILQTINSSMSSYIRLKTITSVSTGVLSFIVLKAVGVDFAFFWSFLIFLLNYIPTIGSLIATVFPVVIALFQFGSWLEPTIVLALVTTIQMIMGNYIEPKIMGNSLNISPLIVLITLVFWGWLWGVVGMIISVPVTLIMIIVFSQYKDLRWIAILLSSDGILPEIVEDHEI